MGIIAAFKEVGTYRGAAAVCGCDPKTVGRARARPAAGASPTRAGREHNHDVVRELVATKVASTKARITAKRLLPEASVAGRAGSARNLRRVVAKAKRNWRAGNHRGRRPAVWSPGECLVIDWGKEDPLHIFCAVLTWSRVRFVRFAADERAETTLRLMAECFETLGGVRKVVLADRRAPYPKTPWSKTEELGHLAELRDRGDISPEEFQRLKDEVIGPGLTPPAGIG